MTITDFSLLSIADQLEILHSEGVYLAKRRIGSRHVILYQYRHLYAEIFYVKYRQEIELIRFSAHTEFIDPYLDELTLQDLFSSDS